MEMAVMKELIPAIIERYRLDLHEAKFLHEMHREAIATQISLTRKSWVNQYRAAPPLGILLEAAWEILDPHAFRMVVAQRRI